MTQIDKKQCKRLGKLSVPPLCSFRLLAASQKLHHFFLKNLTYAFTDGPRLHWYFTITFLSIVEISCMERYLFTVHYTCFRATFMTKSNRFDLLANAYKINIFVINLLKNKCICLNAHIDLI